MDRPVPFAWLPDFLLRLQAQDIRAEEPEQTLAPARILLVDDRDWADLARKARKNGMRWCAIWGEDRGDRLLVTACLEHRADRLLLRTALDPRAPVLASHAPYFPAAERPERHLRDLYGVSFSDHPDPRRWTRHKSWDAATFPLRKEFPGAGAGPTPADADYPFLEAHGGSVYEIPVGPIHAGIIEPGHFRFQAVGEIVLNLEERLGYVHKGIEKIAEGRDPEGLARLAARVSGDATVAHAWAACMAMERAAELDVPPRALALRAIMAERERVANHLGDIGTICNDVGFAFAHYQFSRLRELWQRVSAEAFGHRLMMDCVVPGGVQADLASGAARGQMEQLRALRREVTELMAILDEQESLQDRLVATGVLRPEIAAALGCVGYVGRASGQGFDLRRDAPYPPYDGLTVAVPLQTGGDVAARVRVRAEELQVALDLIESLATALPAGGVRAPWSGAAAGAEGLGLVEGWRGEIVSYVRFAGENTIARYYTRDPSWLHWPALEHLIRDNIVPDFPVCNKSVNGSYSGHDL